MKLNILSDLHLGHGPMRPPATDADVVVLAGDIARPVEAIRWACGLGKPVLYVPGNHEFYGSSIAGALDELRRLSLDTGVRVLHNESEVIGGVRFLGTTLWTDFMLYGEAGRVAAESEALRVMHDFKRILSDPFSMAPFSPADSAALFDVHSGWLAAKLSQPHAGPTVVITHHAPSPRSIHPRFAGSVLNPCFVSAAEHLVTGSGAKLWVHGHLHDSFDYLLGTTRVVCNPRGYSKDGRNENPEFDPGFCIDLDAGGE